MAVFGRGEPVSIRLNHRLALSDGIEIRGLETHEFCTLSLI